LPPFALAFASLAAGAQLSEKQFQKMSYWAALTGVIFVGVSFLFVFKPSMVAKSQKPIIQAWLNQNPPIHSRLIY